MSLARRPWSRSDRARIARSWSPSTTLPVRVHGQAAVGVAVEGEAGVGAVLDDRRAQRLEVGRAAVVVDVEAVGVGVDRDDRRAGVLQGAGTGRVGGALGAVEHDLEPHQRVGDRALEVGGVLLDRGVVGRDPADVATGGPLPRLAHAALDGDLDRVVELVPAAGQELDAVVGHRVVRGREHHAEVGAEALGHVGHAGRGQHAQQQHVDACGGEPGDDRRLEELPGDARVPTHHGQGTVPLELAAVGQDMCCAHGQVQGQLRRQRGVRQAPDPVRAEESRHGTRP